MKAYSAKKVIKDGVAVDGRYDYRGIRIKRDDSLKGYWGHWKTLFSIKHSNGAEIRVSSNTKSNLLAEIDKILDARV